MTALDTPGPERTVTQISGEVPPSRDRHARESTARAAKMVMVGSSREAVRQFKAINRTSPDLAAQVMSGELSLNAAYRDAVGETRRPLYQQLPAWLDDRLHAAADALGMSRQQVARMALVEFLGDEEDDE